MFDFGSIGSSVMDFADKAVSSVVGGINSVGSWAQKNPGGASLLGSVLVAGGSYMENRNNIKAQEKAQQKEWDRQDSLYNAPINTTPLNFQVSTGLTGNSDMLGNGALTGNGVLSNLRNKGVA